MKYQSSKAYLDYSLPFKMEATSYSETSFDSQRATRHYIPEDRILYNHCCDNLKSYTLEECDFSPEIFLGLKSIKLVV
jgi:hypothetical protein